MFAIIDIIVDPEIVGAAQNLLKTAVLALLGFLGTAASIGLTVARKRIMAWVTAKANKAQSDAKGSESSAHYEAMRCVVLKLDTWSTHAVAEVEQTLVRQLKADKKWNTETALEARDTAVEIMTRHAGDHGLSELQQCTGLGLQGVLGMFRTWIESKVSKQQSDTRPDPQNKRPIVPMRELAEG